MAGPPLSIRIIGLDRYRRNLKDLTGRPLANLLTSASDHAKKVAAEGVGGTAARSIQSEVQPTSARVFSLMSEARATSIELGRPAGGPRLHPDSPFALARHIARRGVRGRFFMQAAIRSTESVLPQLIGTMARQVESRFGRR